jgi:catechol 2,3-dioxygenase-like lactoylglutathione lyase family enzyme
VTVFERLDCVCLHMDDLGKSLEFMTAVGMTEAWRLDRLDDGRPWTLVGLDFADKTSSQLVLSTHPDRRFIEVEIKVADVRQAYEELRAMQGVSFVVEPFAIETGYVAVMTAPDDNEFVLIGG